MRHNYDQFMALEQKEKQILLGTLLGDGTLSTSKKGKVGKVQLSLAHCAKQQGYVKWLFDNFPNLRQPEGRVHQWKSGYITKTGEKKWFETFGFSTRFHPILQRIRPLLYQNGKKTITRKYLNLLDPQAIAVWWMDDGNCNWRARQGSLATQCFSLEEHELLKRWFRVVWGIEVKISVWHDYGKPYNILRFNAENMQRLIKLIKPYIPECMNYKVDMHYVKPSTYNVDFLPTRTVLKTVEKI